MFDLVKPMLIASLKQCADVFEDKALELVNRANALVPGQHTETRIVLYTRAGIWQDAAEMIRKSFP